MSFSSPFFLPFQAQRGQILLLKLLHLINPPLRRSDTVNCVAVSFKRIQFTHFQLSFQIKTHFRTHAQQITMFYPEKHSTLDFLLELFSILLIILLENFQINSNCMQAITLLGLKCQHICGSPDIKKNIVIATKLQKRLFIKTPSS